MRWTCISVSQHVATFAPRGYLVMSKDTVSLHGCSGKVQLLLLTLDEGYLLTSTPPDLERGIAPLGPPAPTQPLLLECGVAPLGCCA